MTGYDQTFPQHYGVPTAALDWTTDFKIALFFAVKSYLKNENGFCISNTVPSGYFSIYVFSHNKHESIWHDMKLVLNLPKDREPKVGKLYVELTKNSDSLHYMLLGKNKEVIDVEFRHRGDNPEAFTIPEKLDIKDNKLKKYLLKMISKQHCYIETAPADVVKNNERAIAQKGYFTYFLKPISYKLINGQYPKMEDYITEAGAYNILKYNIKLSDDILKNAEDILRANNINNKKLLLD